MTNGYLEKLSHISDLIRLSRADGYESEMELTYIHSVAEKLGIDNDDLEKLKSNELKVKFSPPRHESEIIPQFHRMLMLVGIDRLIYKEELNLCSDLGLRMGLHPSAVKEALDNIVCCPGSLITAGELEGIFKKYYN